MLLYYDILPSFLYYLYYTSIIAVIIAYIQIILLEKINSYYHSCSVKRSTKLGFFLASLGVYRK